MRIAILAAGVGSRLGQPFPKPLTPLAAGQSIMSRQIELLTGRFTEAPIHTVVGFKKDLIIEEFPDSVYIYNRDYGDTNTSKSLLKALKLTGHHDVLWLNGDVVFEPEIVNVIGEAVERGESFVCVNTASVGDEEVKYDIDADGAIRVISKTVTTPRGEAVGINYVNEADKASLVTHLEACAPDDYFERGIELAIEQDGVRFLPLDITGLMCVEVDFAEDLERARSWFPDGATTPWQG